MKHLKKYNESALTDILVDTFCDLADDFPVSVKVGPLHNRVVIHNESKDIKSALARHVSSGWEWQDMEWLKNILPVIASKINYLSEEEGIDREYCDVQITYTKKYDIKRVAVGTLRDIDGDRKFVFEDEITGPNSIFRLYPVADIYIGWPGFEMKNIKAYNESKEHDTYSMFKHLWDDISDDENFIVDFHYDTTYKSYRAMIFPSSIHNEKVDGFTIKELGDRLLLPFSYSKELGITIDYIQAVDTDATGYEVDECVGYTPTLNEVMEGKYTITQFLEEWERDYITGGEKLMELSFTFLTLAYKED